MCASSITCRCFKVSGFGFQNSASGFGASTFRALNIQVPNFKYSRGVDFRDGNDQSKIDHDFRGGEERRVFRVLDCG